LRDTEVTNPAAYILLNRPELIDTTKVVRALIERYPDISALKPPQAPGGDTADSNVLAFAGHVFALMNFDKPIPPKVWQMAVQRARYWPEAETVCGRHQGNMMVCAMGEAEDKLRVAQVTTAVVGAIVATHPQCSAVLWGTATVNSSASWADRSLSAFRGNPSLLTVLWVSVYGFRNAEKNRVGVITIGLQNFVGREIEMEAAESASLDLLNKVYGFANYLLQHGATVRDGDTIGSSANERFMIRLAESRRIPGLPVFATDLPAA
jgi:hypothetical protein